MGQRPRWKPCERSSTRRCWGIKPTPWSSGSFWNISLVYKFVISYIYSLVCNGICFIPSQTNMGLGFCNRRGVEYVLCGLLFHLFFLSLLVSDWLVSNEYVTGFSYTSVLHTSDWGKHFYYSCFIHHADVVRLRVLIGRLLIPLQ